MSAGFKRFKEIIDSHTINGAERYSTWRKSPSQVSTTGVWFDLSMSPGNPTPKYWFDAVPLTATRVYQSSDGGLFHGGNVSPNRKYLRELMTMAVVATALPMPMILMDYLMYYPTIDESVTEPQVMFNNVTIPRYTDGAGVQMMAVSIAGRTGGQTFSVSYTNQDGVSGRTSVTVIQNSVSVIGSIVTSNRAVSAASGAFIPLQSGDTGVRSIESVTMNGQDVGLFTLILVRPLAQFSIRGIDAPVEVDYLRNFSVIPEIKDDAFLNFICLPNGSLGATSIHGSIKTISN